MCYKFYSNDEVRSKYIAKGSFYYIDQGYIKGYRNDLHIFDRSFASSKDAIKSSKPDILFIMMNPGGSKPLASCQNHISKDILVDWLKRDNLVDADADCTQDQIMRIMWNTGAQHCRIINISDIREGSSVKKIFPYIRNINDLHSIFSQYRSQELANVFNSLDSKAFIFKAWGVNKSATFRKLVGRSIRQLPKTIQSIGLVKDDDEYLYYHPYSPDPNVLEEWFYKAMALIKKEIPDEWYKMMEEKYNSCPGVGVCQGRSQLTGVHRDNLPGR